MITTDYISTERLELPTEKMIKEKEDLKQVSFIESLKTSSELQPFATAPKICSAYYPLFHIILQRLARGQELGNEQLSRIEVITTNCDSLLESILGISWNQTLSIYPTLDLGALERLYALRRRAEIIKFLEENPFLFPLLQEAHEQIRNYFGKLAQVVLEVVTDPEVTGDQELVIFVRTKLPPEEAVKQLEELDEKWWLDVPANARKKLCIDVEFE